MTVRAAAACPTRYPSYRGEKLALAKYMQTEYVDHMRKRDGSEHGCATCHSSPFNPRFLPRIDDPEGWVAPAAHPGPQP